jgi:predicted nucleotidyltransferase
MDLREIEDKLRAIPERFPAVRLIYLFGSQATGDPGPLSDYDLGILLAPSGNSSEFRARLHHELIVLLAATKVDVVWLSGGPVELAYAIICQGVVVYQRDLATRVEYEARIMGQYGDYLPVLRAQRAEILCGGDHAVRVQRYREALRRTERTLSQIRAAQSQT